MSGWGLPDDYDYQSYIERYGVPDQSKGQHLTDEFKLPNHITFSDESVYSTPEQQGGQWKEEGGRWHYYASPYVVNRQGAGRITDYFKRFEPDATLHLPPAMPRIGR
jgi:hypothetical protein